MSEHSGERAVNALQSQVSRLRQALARADAAPTLVEFHPAGYRLAIDPDDVDAHRFARLAAIEDRVEVPFAAVRAGQLKIAVLCSESEGKPRFSCTK